MIKNAESPAAKQARHRAGQAPRSKASSPQGRPSAKLKRFFCFWILLTLVALLYPLEAGLGAGHPGVLVVKIKAKAGVSKLPDYGQAEFLFENTYRLHVVDQVKVKSQLQEQPSSSWVEYVEEDMVLKSAVNASDKLFVLDEQELTRQWYLPKMKVHSAWERTVGNNITVAVVDTGIDGKHEDLNDGRIIGGFINYCQVQSLVLPNECLLRMTGELAAGVNSDDNGHGTIVAGLIGAIANNQKGIAGINWNVRIMPIKALDANGSGFASDVATGMRWAVDHGAKIINLSIGGPGLEGVGIIEDAVRYAFERGILVVAAAGNDAAVTGGDLNTNPVLPVCADGGQNMIVGVAAVDAQDRKARFSNYGSKCIDIAAPGTGTFVDKQQKQGLPSTYFDPTRPGEHDLYVYAVGTSVAAPMVTGVAALMMSIFSDLDVKALRDRLIGSVDNIDSFNTVGCNGASCIGQIGKGRVNALKAVLETTASFSSGTLVRGLEGATFLIERGLKLPISDFVLTQRFAGATIISASAEQLASLPLGQYVSPSDGTIIKEPASPTVYLVEAGKKHALSYIVFLSRNLRFEDVVTLSAQEIINYPPGEDAVVLDGVLLKSRNHPAVYILDKGTRRLLSWFVFNERSLNGRPMAEVSEAELAIFPLQPNGFLYPPLNNTLIRGHELATVYLFEDGKKRGINLRAFQNRGYSFSDVVILPQSEVEGYERGEDIIE